MDDGEVATVLGPNGAGKTTLLRALAGLLPLEHGRVELDGEVVDDVERGIRRLPEERGVAVVFQDLLLFPHLSALDNVAFGPRSRGVPRLEARRRAAAWLERLGVGDVAASRPRALSGGQAQRVAMARALVMKPRVLLLDEPLSAVDPSARPELRRTLRQQLEAGDGVRLVVTHDPLEAATLAPRVIVVEEGRITHDGSFADLAARPRSAWMARTAGVNLLSGDADAGTLRLGGGGGALSIVGGASGRVLASIHPRAVALHRLLPEGSPRNVLSLRVVDLDAQGDSVRVRLDGPIPLVAEVTVAAAAELRLAEGGTVHAAVKATEIEVYPA